MQRNPSYTIIVEAGCHLHIPMAHAHAHVHGTKDEDWFVAQGWSDTVQPYHIQEREGRKPTKNAQGQTSQKASHTWSQGYVYVCVFVGAQVHGTQGKTRVMPTQSN
eukprot:gb/GECG01005572.1/.p1 GENE.gb/GECG01005572.1/~~gb/GECG01005572.1/.p1  ORF type:complete len:106 (+),score=7.96 gb/GECG01005572.1/:1-318(+)